MKKKLVFFCRICQKQYFCGTKINIMNFKKLTLTFVGAVALASSVSAQEAETTSNSGNKFAAGDNNLEFTFASPFASANPFGLENNTVKYRKFVSSSVAYRLSASLTYSSESTVTQQEDSDADLELLKDKESAFGLMLAPGYEMHFAGSEKLSPYVGGQVIIGYNSSSDRTEDQDADDKLYYTKTKNGSMSFGFGGVAGFDYYIAKSLYVGAELNYNLVMTNDLATKTKSDLADFEEPDPSKNGGSTSFAPAAVSSFRIGFLF